MSASDPYGAVAEYYDLLAAPLWATRGPFVRRSFQGTNAAYGTVLDVGAGTGLALAEVAYALPTAPLMAIEPSRGMRIALSTRVGLLGIAGRTTIIPGTLRDCVIPARLSGALALGVLGHLSQADRARLWEVLSTRLMVGAPALVDVFDRTAPPTNARIRIGQCAVGERHYESWSEGRAEPDGTRVYTIRYRVIARGELVSEHCSELRWSPLTLGGLRSEVGPYGLQLREVAPDLAIVTVGQHERESR